MLSYKQYKALNESIMPTFALGVNSPSNLGVIVPSAFSNFEEAKMSKKKSKKKMEDDEETGDGEIVSPASEKDDPNVDVDVGEDDDVGCKMCGSKSKKKSKKKMWSDEDDAAVDEDLPDEDMEDEDEEEDEDMEDEDEDMEDEDEEDVPQDKSVGNGVGKPMFSKKSSKKKSKKKCSADMDMEDHESVEEDEDDEDGEMEGKELAFSKKKSKKNLKKESTEEEKWWNSVKSMVGPPPDTKYNDGWTEYQTGGFSVVDTENLTQAIRSEEIPPKAGGFFY